MYVLEHFPKKRKKQEPGDWFASKNKENWDIRRTSVTRGEKGKKQNLQNVKNELKARGKIR